MARTSTTCSILLKTWARETRSAFSWNCTLVWWRSYTHTHTHTHTHRGMSSFVAVATAALISSHTFSTASGKFLLKKRTTSFTPQLLFVLTVIM